MTVDRAESSTPDRLQVLTGLCSILFTIGTALQAFWVVNRETLERMMVLAGQSDADATDAAPGFLTGFRLVGCLYLVGNALGILALRRQNLRWLFWVVLAVNVTQAAGVWMVPPEMFEAVVDEYGWVGAVPSAVTDGGAALLAIVLLYFLVRTRSVWASRSR